VSKKIETAGKTLEELESLLAVIEAKSEEHEINNPLSKYIPTGKQEELLHAVGEENGYWQFILPAGNSSGKSCVSVAILANIMWGPQSDWFDLPRFRQWPYPQKKFWYISEQSTLKETIVGTDEIGQSEIKKWFPVGRYDLSKGGYEFYSKLTTDTGWIGTFKTFDMDQSKFESDKISVAIFDEPPPEAIYNAVLARLTLGGIVLMPMTPLSSSAWVKDRLVDKAGPGSGIFVLYADIESACKTHGVRGFLDHDIVMRIVAEYDEEERDAREKGTFMHLSGLVYKGLHPSIHRHTRAPESFTQDQYRIFNIVDPHPTRPPAIIWAAVDRQGRVFVVDEWPPMEQFGHYHKINKFSMTTREVCEEIKNIEAVNGWNPQNVMRVMDPNYGPTKNNDVGLSTQQLFFKHGRELSWPLRYNVNVNDDIHEGHRAVKDLIFVNPDGQTRLLIGQNCAQTWYQMTHYAWKPRRGERADVDGPSERVGQRFKDLPDTVRYLAMFMRGPQAAKAPKPKLPEYLELMQEQARADAGDWRNPFEV